MNLLELAGIRELSPEKAKINSQRMLGLAFRLTRTKPQEKDMIIKALNLSMVFEKRFKAYLKGIK